MDDEYDPQWLALERAGEGPKELQGTPQEMRDQYDAMLLALSQQWPAQPSVHTRDFTIGSDSPVGQIQIRVYSPSLEQDVKLPLGVLFHGGGWLSGTLDSEHAQCCLIAKETPCVIFSVGYKLAPEHKTPEILDSCAFALRYAYTHATELGADPEKLFTIGGSAGATLALHFAPASVGKNIMGAPVRGCIALNPVAIYPEQPPSGYQHLYQSFKELEFTAPFIKGPNLRGAFESIATKPGDRDMVDFVYSDTSYHSQFPPTYIATCEKDLMRDDGAIMEALLGRAGVSIKRDHYMGMPHYFFIYSSLDMSRIFFENTAAGIRFVLEASANML